MRPRLAPTRAWGAALALLLSCGLAACEQEAQDAPPQATFGAGESCDDGLSCVHAGVEQVEVDSFTLIHREIEGSPRVSARIFMDGGARDWDADSCHALEVALMLGSWWGSESHVGNEFHDALSALGASYSVGSGVDFAHLSVQAPAAHFEEAYALLAETLRAPIARLLRDGSFDHALGVYENRWVTELDDAGSAAQATAYGMVFGGHPYNLKRETFERAQDLRARDLAGAIGGLVFAAHPRVVVVGGVSLSRARDAVRGSLPRTTGLPPLPELPAPTPGDAWAAILDYPDAPNWHVSAVFPAPAPTDPDYPALLLGLSSLDDLLFEELRTRSALVYTAGASLSADRVNSGRLWLSTAHPREALERFHQVLEEAQQLPIDDVTLDGARAQQRTLFHARSGSPSDIAWTLGRWQLLTGDATRADEHQRALQDLTAEEVREALARYLPQARYAAAGAGGELTETMLLGRDPGDGPEPPAVDGAAATQCQDDAQLADFDAECAQCLCAQCPEVAEQCDQTCWALLACTASHCDGNGNDSACVVQHCSDLLGAAEPASLTNECREQCPEHCAQR